MDLALDEERCRCDEDSIEKQGLDLLEPRPVGPVGIPMDLNANVSGRTGSTGNSDYHNDNGNGNGNDNGNEHNENEKTGSIAASSCLSPTWQPQSQQQPRFVMGGIAEVMEGRG